MSALAEPKESEEETEREIVPGSLPLSDPLRERYAQFCALGYSNSEAGRHAGYAAGSGAHNKARKAKQVQDRIWFLSGDSLALIRERRAMLNKRYLRLIHAEPTVPEIPAGEEPADPAASLIGRVVEYDADGAIKGSRYDPKIALEAAAQYRRMNGLDQAEKYADPDGRALGSGAAEAAQDAAIAAEAMTDEDRQRALQVWAARTGAKIVPRDG